MTRLALVIACIASTAFVAVLASRRAPVALSGSLVRHVPVVAPPDHTYELALQHEAIRQLAIAVQVLGAECNPRRKYAPLHLPKGFDVETIEVGGDERPRGFITGGGR